MSNRLLPKFGLKTTPVKSGAYTAKAGEFIPVDTGGVVILDPSNGGALAVEDGDTFGVGFYPATQFDAGYVAIGLDAAIHYGGRAIRELLPGSYAIYTYSAEQGEWHQVAGVANDQVDFYAEGTTPSDTPVKAIAYTALGADTSIAWEVTVTAWDNVSDESVEFKILADFYADALAAITEREVLFLKGPQSLPAGLSTIVVDFLITAQEVALRVTGKTATPLKWVVSGVVIERLA